MRVYTHVQQGSSLEKVSCTVKKADEMIVFLDFWIHMKNVSPCNDKSFRYLCVSWTLTVCVASYICHTIL